MLYTDGAIELLDKHGQELGEAGLSRLVERAAGIPLDLKRVEQRLLEFSNVIRLSDDVTLLSLHRCVSA